VSGPKPLRLAPKVSFAELDGEAVVLHVGSGRYFSVNRTGAVLLPLLAKGTDHAALTGALVTAYGIDVAAARRDVDDWLRLLENGGLLARGAEEA
jgi:hypothetical protein